MKSAARKLAASPTSPTAPYRRFAALETFVVGDGNRLARTAAESVVKRLGAVTPLLVYGPTGCGKTHLLEGIWTAVRRRSRRDDGRAISRPSSSPPTFVEALRGSGLPSFRRKYRGVESLIDRRPAVLRRQAGHAGRIAAHHRHASARGPAIGASPPIGPPAELAELGAGAGHAARRRPGLRHRAAGSRHAAGNRRPTWPRERPARRARNVQSTCIADRSSTATPASSPGR